MTLLETSFTVSDAAKHLNVSESCIRRCLRSCKLFSVDYEGRKRLLRFQFTRGRVVPGIGEVLAALPRNPNPLGLAQWFVSPHPELETTRSAKLHSPRQWLLAGKPLETLIDLARSYSEAEAFH